jgi:hypothetical protein
MFRKLCARIFDFKNEGEGNFVNKSVSKSYHVELVLLKYHLNEGDMSNQVQVSAKFTHLQLYSRKFILPLKKCSPSDLF